MRWSIGIILVLILLSACAKQDLVCNKPYIQVGTNCCLDQNGDGMCDEKASSETTPVSFSAADIYGQYADTVYYVKTECLYTHSYPDFFLRSAVSGKWGVDIDLAMRKNETISTSSESNQAAMSKWSMMNRENSTKQYGTAFLVGNKLYTNNHVVECSTKPQEIVAYFDLIDLSGQDVNAIGSKIYTDQENFEEMRVSRDLIMSAVNRTIAEHFRSKANFTLVERKILLYNERDNFTHPITVHVITNGTNFPGLDYATLSIDEQSSKIQITSMDDQHIGDTIYLIGFPYVISFEKPENHGQMQTNPPIITRGVISNKILSDSNHTYYVIDAAATFGSSGSPVFNSQGKVIGIMTAGDYYSNVNLFLPLETIPK